MEVSSNGKPTCGGASVISSCSVHQTTVKYVETALNAVLLWIQEGTRGWVQRILLTEVHNRRSVSIRSNPHTHLAVEGAFQIVALVIPQLPEQRSSPPCPRPRRRQLRVPPLLQAPSRRPSQRARPPSRGSLCSWASWRRPWRRSRCCSRRRCTRRIHERCSLWTACCRSETRHHPSTARARRST